MYLRLLGKECEGGVDGHSQYGGDVLVAVFTMEAEFNRLNHATWECRVPRRVHAEEPKETAIRQDKAASGSGVSRSRATEGVPDRGRTFWCLITFIC
jgi:hypothetical protein